MRWSLVGVLITYVSLVKAQDGEAQGIAPCPDDSIPVSPEIANAEAIGDSSAPVTSLPYAAPTIQSSAQNPAVAQSSTTSYSSVRPPVAPAAGASAGVPSGGPASFATLPLTATALNPAASLPPVTPDTNTTGGRFTLKLITSISNPYSDGYTNGDDAKSLNGSNLFASNQDKQATVNISSSGAQPAFATFQLDNTCFETWDGRVAYVSPSAAVKDTNPVEDVSSVPVFFSAWSNLNTEEQENALSCSLDPTNPTFWQGDPSVPRALTCAGEVNGTPLTNLFVCEQGGQGIAEGYEGTLMMGGGQMPGGCVPVTLSAVGVDEGTMHIIGAGQRKHRRREHKHW